MIIVISSISILFAIVYLLLIFFFYKGWKGLSTDENVPLQKFPSVSVLIAVRNEENNIERLLKALAAQDYPRELYEVIIIDDHSTDRTVEIVSSFPMENLKLIELDNAEVLNSYKKKAIALGMEHSRSDIIITTDGDCSMSRKWISTLVRYYEKYSLKLLSAPVAFYEQKSLFEKIQTVEFQYLIGAGAGSIHNGFPNTCNGANLCYSREVFHELDGFKGIDDIASGDDELFLHKVANNYPNRIGFVKNKDAIVFTHAKKTFPEFIEQRKRWASKSMKYNDKRIVLVVSMVFLFNVSLLLNIMLGFWDPVYWNVFALQFLLKAFIDGLFIHSTLSFFDKRNYILLLPPVLFLYTFYIIAIGIYANLGRSYSWKGRIVR